MGARNINIQNAPLTQSPFKLLSKNQYFFPDISNFKESLSEAQDRCGK